jgi:anti-sigma regulatory factor (Ser/Thr protein kinase)
MNLQLCFHLPEVSEQIVLLRDKVVQHLACLDIEPEDIADVRIVITELAANAIEHGYSGNGYEVSIQVAGASLTISVTDNGKGFPKEYPLPGTLRAKVRKSARFVDSAEDVSGLRYGGWGLPLVCAATDRLEVLPVLPYGTTVRATKKIRYVSAGDTAKSREWKPLHHELSPRL